MVIIINIMEFLTACQALREFLSSDPHKRRSVGSVVEAREVNLPKVAQVARGRLLPLPFDFNRQGEAVAAAVPG